ncbi:hypothetical protein ACQ4PT_012158 [Festuca glaucescens]
MGFLTGACSGDGIPLFFSSPLWTSAGAEHGAEGHLAEFHRPAMVAASPAAPLVIGAPTPPRTAEQGGQGRRATRPVVDLDRAPVWVIVVWNGETRIIISVLFSSPKCRILTLLALQLQWTGGWFKRQCLPFDPAAAPGSASGKIEHPTSGRLSGPVATGHVVFEAAPRRLLLSGDLPLDVLYDILLRVPAKDLCRLRAVTSVPLFAAAHKSRHTAPLLAIAYYDYKKGDFVDIVDLTGNVLRRIPGVKCIWVKKYSFPSQVAWCDVQPLLVLDDERTLFTNGTKFLKGYDERTGTYADALEIGNFRTIAVYTGNLLSL